jgi:hypothetical protein
VKNITNRYKPQPKYGLAHKAHANLYNKLKIIFIIIPKQRQKYRLKVL